MCSHNGVGAELKTLAGVELCQRQRFKSHLLHRKPLEQQSLHRKKTL